jgi:hypothetical protein
MDEYKGEEDNTSCFVCKIAFNHYPSLKKKIQTSVSDGDVSQYYQMQRRDKEYVHGQLAVEMAQMQGIFSREEQIWDVDRDKKDVEKAPNNVDSTLTQWQLQLEQTSLISDEEVLNSNN